MFEKRNDLYRLLTVAEAGTISAAADRLGMTQPALSRLMAKLEREFRGRLFERLTTGVRPTALGATAVDLARRVLREIEAAEGKIDAALSGRSGCFRITAGPTWMQAVLPPAVRQFHETHPGIELKLGTADFRRGLRLLAEGGTDLHCGGVDGGEPLPAFLRRERLPDTTFGIVAYTGHPLLAADTAAPDDLADYPWIDFGAPTGPVIPDARPSLSAVLEDLHERTSRRVATLVRAGTAGFFLMAAGPYLSWESLAFLERTPEPGLRPLPLEFGRHRCRTGFLVRRAAEDFPPFRLLRKILRETALGNGAMRPDMGRMNTQC